VSTGGLLTLSDLQERFVDLLRKRIRNGEFTGRGLARLVGVSQPHMHNMLRGRRRFSAEVVEDLMCRLRVDARSLMEPVESWPEET
jgi:hypothetical protein